MKEKVEEDGATRTTKNIKEYKTLLSEKVAQAKKEIEQERPDLSESISAKVQINPYKKRPTGFSKVIKDLVEEMFLPYGDGINKTKKKLIEDLANRHPEHTVTQSILYNELQHYQRKMIEKKKRGSGIDKIPTYKTFAELYDALKIYFHTIQGKPKRFKSEILIGSECVTIGKKTYPISLKKSKGQEYPSIRINLGNNKRVWIRIDALEHLLSTIK